MQRSCQRLWCFFFSWPQAAHLARRVPSPFHSKQVFPLDAPAVPNPCHFKRDAPHSKRWPYPHHFRQDAVRFKRLPCSTHFISNFTHFVWHAGLPETRCGQELWANARLDPCAKSLWSHRCGNNLPYLYTCHGGTTLAACLSRPPESHVEHVLRSATISVRGSSACEEWVNEPVSTRHKQLHRTFCIPSRVSCSNSWPPGTLIPQLLRRLQPQP